MRKNRIYINIQKNKKNYEKDFELNIKCIYGTWLVKLWFA